MSNTHGLHAFWLPGLSMLVGLNGLLGKLPADTAKSQPISVVGTWRIGILAGSLLSVADLSVIPAVLGRDSLKALPYAVRGCYFAQPRRIRPPVSGYFC